MSPFTVDARSSALSVEGKVSVMPPLTVDISSLSLQSARPISPRIEPLTVVADAVPVVENEIDPFTVESATSPFNRSASI